MLATETELHFKSSDGINVGTCTVGMRKFGTERERVETIEHLPFVPAPGLRQLHLTVKLVSIQCLSSSTAYMVAEYHYPRKMGSVPVRTAVSQVSRHGEMTLNAVDSRSFVMSLEDFALCMAEEPIIVTLKAKERNGERDLGYAELPLEELVSVNPQCFGIPKRTNQCNNNQPKPPPSSLPKSLKKTQEAAAAAAAGEGVNDIVEPVQVRVLDQYLDLFSISHDNEMNLTANGTDNSNHQSSNGSNCVVGSLQAVLILEDFGLAEEEVDGKIQDELFGNNTVVMEQERNATTMTNTSAVVKPSSRKGRVVYYTPEGSRREVLEGSHPRYETRSQAQAHFKVKGNAAFETVTGWEEGNGSALPIPSHEKEKKTAVTFHLKDKGMLNDFQHNPKDDSSLSLDHSSYNNTKTEVAELARLRDEWEAWRSKEETNWWEQLRQKEVSLRAKWREREAERAYSMASAAKGYKKLETWLRKSLHEVESRERSLKSLEESLKMEYAHKVGELELLQHRLIDERQHQLEVEKTKVKDLENRLIKEKSEVKAANVKLRGVEEEFDKYREAQRKSPEGTLKVDVMQLQVCA